MSVVNYAPASSFGAFGRGMGGLGGLGGMGGMGGIGGMGGMGGLGGLGGLSGAGTGGMPSAFPAASGFPGSSGFPGASGFSGSSGFSGASGFPGSGMPSGLSSGLASSGMPSGMSSGLGPQSGMAVATVPEPQPQQTQEVVQVREEYVTELPRPPVAELKLSVTPDRVEKLLEQAYSRLDTLGNQLRAAASELEEIRAEILTANNLCDSELRSQLQQANDEIYKLRNQLSECAERKVNKMDKKDLLNL